MSTGVVLQVFPDGGRVEQALAEAARAAAFVDARAYWTISQLEERCALARPDAQRVVTPLQGRVALLAIARRTPAVRQGFGRYVEEPAFARQAWELLEQLEAQGVSPQMLITAARDLGPARLQRVEALVALWRALAAEHQRRGRQTPEEALRSSLELFEARLPPALAPFAGVQVQHLSDLPLARVRWLQALGNACAREGKSFVLELPGSGNPGVDALVNEVFRRFEAPDSGADAEHVRLSQAQSPFTALSDGLFRSEPPRVAPPTEGLSLVCAATGVDEARAVAGRVRALLDEGAGPEEVAIVVRDLGEDTERLVEALGAYGVPCRARLGLPLARSAVGALALGLPRLVEERFPAAGVLAVLESRHAGRIADGAPDAQALILEAGLRDDLLGALGGQGAWALRLEALAARLERTRQGARAAAARAVAVRVARLLELARLLPDEATFGRFLEGWWKAVGALGILEGLKAQEPHDAQLPRLTAAVERALASDQAAAEALEDFARALREALVEAGLEQVATTRAAFHRFLLDAAQDVNLAARGPRTGAVWLLEAREASGRRFPHVLLAGLNEGRFPRAVTPPALLSEDERGALNAAAKAPLFRLRVGDAGATLPVRLAEDRLLLHHVLGAAQHTLQLSWRRADGAGRELSPSVFVEELHRVSHDASRRAIRWLPLRAVPLLEEVRSEDELRARAALEGLSAPQTRLTAVDLVAPQLRERFALEPWWARARMQQSIATERMRYFGSETVAAGPFTGDVSEVLGLLGHALSFDAQQPLSPSALDVWGNCGMQGFLRAVARVRGGEAEGEEASASTRGVFWHEVLHRLVPRLVEEGLLGTSVPDARLSSLLDEAVAGAAQVIEEQHSTGHPQVWALGQARARSVVRTLVQRPEAVLPFAGLQPVRHEVAFGPRATDAAWRRAVLPAAFPGELDVHFFGQIDRVDQGAEGVGVVDYKSTLPKVTRWLENDFQLHVYLHVASAALGRRPVNGAVVAIGKDQLKALAKPGAGVSIETLLAVDAATRVRAREEGAPNLANAVHGVLGRRRAGDFGPRAVDCNFCEFARVCRISERTLDETEGDT